MKPDLNQPSQNSVGVARFVRASFKAVRRARHSMFQVLLAGQTQPNSAFEWAKKNQISKSGWILLVNS